MTPVTFRGCSLDVTNLVWLTVRRDEVGIANTRVHENKAPTCEKVSLGDQVPAVPLSPYDGQIGSSFQYLTQSVNSQSNVGTSQVQAMMEQDLLKRVEEAKVEEFIKLCQGVNESIVRRKNIEANKDKSYKDGSSRGRLKIQDKSRFKKSISNQVHSKFPKARDYRISNLRFQNGRGSTSPSNKHTCGECGKKHMGYSVVSKRLYRNIPIILPNRVTLDK
ncbi:hypothetical protein EJD97_006874 [Solanum chilense]|uniref:Uncharacterized protein n=1 Tax=Solanum chilense TaxID=4083 RepID=A0A6N2BSZ9_SOLCI|nr:hypothetical protein EJD97_006874 [Solanum chilense]